MAYTDIDKPSDYFNTKLYTGNGSTQSITGVGFKPDWVWLKHRDGAQDNNLFDAVRGVTKYIESNTNDAEATDVNRLTSFNTDGFTLGNEAVVNGNYNLYVSWNWLGANGTASNTDGSITSTVSANTTSGFSIVSWTGTGTNPSTIGHGLGTAPSCIILKNRDASGGIGDWYVGHDGIGWTDRLKLNTTGSTASSSTLWNNTAPTSSVFTISSALNFSGDNTIAYCFAPKKGFSAMGQYTGNGSTDGPFIYTGFKPSFLLIKRTDSAYHWYIHDNKRNPFNVMDKELYPSQVNAEGTAVTKDFLSNGVKIRGTQVSQNASGGSYIYMAFAENPFVTSTGIPTCAR